MANTDKQNFRYDQVKWAQAMRKLADMRAAGYDIDMTRLLGAEVDRFLAQAPAATAKKLRIKQESVPVKEYHQPFTRLR